MIPGDLASRLRVLLESSVQPLPLIQEIPADLPRFEAGDHFTAQLQSPLPDGSFRALVAGKTITLALPQGAKSGDVMELVVTAQRGGTVIARQVDTSTPPAVNSGDLPKPVLSQTGQLISQLLTGRYGEAEAMPLSRTGTPLAPALQNPAEIAKALKQVVSDSGLFYESHLRQWVEGKLPLSAVLQEPQAQQPPLPNPATPAGQPLPQTPEHATAPLAQTPQQAQATEEGKPSLPETVRNLRTANGTLPSASFRGDTTDLSGDPTVKQSLAHRSVAEPLMPVVQHQLETLSSHQMSWQGQVWPGVQMQWNIIDPDDQSQRNTQGGEEDDTAKYWRSALRLQLPNLGDVQAMLVLGPQGLSLKIDTDSASTAENMRVAGPQLHDSLAASGVDLIQLQISNHVSS